ncbi:IclR family transcriptional regulator [Rathayibacter sp. PhB93]|uniref:IclR family transcriptional regulator n=1 Tax=unclassified Rathayibacter TaxID=2609250 RepID=UPI000F497EA1|nr:MULTISPECIES: IclR family transcriptional regulator [unclassified Rathayibacter]ROQ04626.1 IclR family transcriptional regulator [Rathayibacter sp. PhB93]TDQ13464.1 IclR family transcriptional regulator [Rathayibacter sp. PhB1]
MVTTIQSVERAVQIVLLVADEPRVLAGDIAARLGLTASTTHHLLSTLVQEGLLSKDSARQYELGDASERIADAVTRQLRPPAELRHALAELARRTGESCYLTAWRGDRIRVIAVTEGDHAVRVSGLVVGYSDDIHARVGARVMLAHADERLRDWALSGYDYTALTSNTLRSRAELEAELERIRSTGIARDEEELRTGVYSISVPIRVDGRVRAALSLTAPIDRFRANEDAYIAALHGCAASARP